MKVFIACLLSLSLTADTVAQDYSKIDVTEFYKDIQVWKKQDNNMLLAWWLPSEYWGIAFEGNATVSQEIKNKIKSAFSDYSLFCMADITYIDYNTTAYRSYTELIKTFSVIDSSGNILLAEDESMLPGETIQLGALLKPFLSKLIGKVGEGISVFYIKNKNANSINIFDPFKASSFKVTLSDQIFQWQLPLPSLLPKKLCPVDGREMNGGWNYCPVHGVKL